MLFASTQFLLFFVAVYALYLVLEHRWQNWLLLLASYVFYASFDWRFCLLLFALTVISWQFGNWIDSCQKNTRKRAAFMWGAVAINLGTLIFFKYCGFFADSMTRLLSALHFNNAGAIASVAMPLGLSFYVFQTLSYAIDVDRQTCKPCRNLADFALYVAFFPKLVAGPIERCAHFIPQIEQPRTLTLAMIYEGFFLCLWGLYQKVLIADNLGRFVDSSYQNLNGLSGLESLLTIYAFSFQLYADFAGYSNIARGLGKMMGFDVMENFRFPFFATNILEFWKRWHISLTSWLRDYVYFPFYFKTKQLVLSSILVFVLNGIWHGTTFNFVVMGLYWGVVVAVTTLVMMHRRNKEQVADKKPLIPAPALTLLAVVFTFHLNCFGFLLFRSVENSQISTMLQNLLSGNYALTESASVYLLGMMFYILPLLVIEYFQNRHNDPLLLIQKSPQFQFALYIGLFLQAVSASMYVPSLIENAGEFIYFRF